MHKQLHLSRISFILFSIVSVRAKPFQANACDPYFAGEPVLLFTCPFSEWSLHLEVADLYLSEFLFHFFKYSERLVCSNLLTHLIFSEVAAFNSDNIRLVQLIPIFFHTFYTAQEFVDLLARYLHSPSPGLL